MLLSFYTLAALAVFARRAHAFEIDLDLVFGDLHYGRPCLFDIDQVTKNIYISLVAENAFNIANHSWEYGAVTQAFIELYTPDLSPLSGLGSIPPLTCGEDSIPGPVWSIVRKIMANVGDGSPTLMDGDGAAGDPPSVGPAVLLANTVERNETWARAVNRQLNHILKDVPRSSDGGISHRENQVAFWADSVYMVPPFLAYYGALDGFENIFSGFENGAELLREAYRQCRSYRNALFDEDVSLWRHIIYGDFLLPQHWGTGNAWAAYGMMRVLATIRAAPWLAFDMDDEQEDLVKWITEILVGAWAFQQPNGTLFNYIDQPANQTFADSASTALMAAATYRLAVVTQDDRYIPNAERAYKLIIENLDEGGWILDAVDPLKFDAPLQPGKHSPEAQAFTVMLQAARDAYHYPWWFQKANHARCAA